MQSSLVPCGEAPVSGGIQHSSFMHCAREVRWIAHAERRTVQEGPRIGKSTRAPYIDKAYTRDRTLFIPPGPTAPRWMLDRSRRLEAPSPWPPRPEGRQGDRIAATSRATTSRQSSPHTSPHTRHDARTAPRARGTTASIKVRTMVRTHTSAPSLATIGFWVCHTSPCQLSAAEPAAVAAAAPSWAGDSAVRSDHDRHGDAGEGEPALSIDIEV